MAKNSETRTVLAHRRASDFVSRQIDSSEDTAPAHVVQASHLARRFKLSPAMMAVVAGHIYGTAETWRGRL